MSAIGMVSVKDTPQIVQTHHTAAVELIKLIEHKFATTQVITTSSSRPVAKLDMLVCATTRCHHCNSRSHNQAAHVHDHQCQARMVYAILALPPMRCTAVSISGISQILSTHLTCTFGLS